MHVRLTGMVDRVDTRLDVHEGNTWTDANDHKDPVPRQMSTDPDTATDGSIPSFHSYGESMIIPTLRTKRGILGLLRSACPLATPQSSRQ